MQINQFKYSKTYNSFGSKKLFPVVVRDMKNRSVNAWFTEYKCSDQIDRITIRNLVKEWNKLLKLSYTKAISDNFHQNYKIYAIEEPTQSLDKKILCIASAKKEKGHSLYIEYIQASPEALFDSKNRKYKGAGIAIMYGIVKIAHRRNFDTLWLHNHNQKFYKKIKNKKCDLYMRFILNQPEMRKFLKSQEAKWQKLIKKNEKNNMSFKAKLKSFFNKITD